jgi:hypothetical protein
MDVVIQMDEQNLLTLRPGVAYTREGSEASASFSRKLAKMGIDCQSVKTVAVSLQM